MKSDSPAAEKAKHDKPTESATSNQGEGRTQPHRSRTGLTLLAVALLLVGVWPAYSYYQRQQQEHFERTCKELFLKENWSELKDQAKAWLAINDGSDDARIYLSDACLQLDEVEAAVDLMGKVSNDFPGAIDVLAAQAEILLTDLNRPFEAVATWQRMLKINPAAGRAHQRLIYFYAMTLQRERMLSQIDDSMQAGCEPPEAYTYLLMANAINFSDGLVKTTRWRISAMDDENLEVAQAVYAAKKTAEDGIATFGVQTVIPGETELLDRCLEKYPDNLEVLALQIEFAMFSGDSDKVTELIGKVPESAKTDSRFWRYRGWLLTQQKRYELAIEALQQAINLLPFDWPSRILLADLYRKTGNAKDAEVQARISETGKSLQSQLFERPTARALTPDLANDIRDYLKEIGAENALAAMERRLN